MKYVNTISFVMNKFCKNSNENNLQNGKSLTQYKDIFKTIQVDAQYLTSNH